MKLPNWVQFALGLAGVVVAFLLSQSASGGMTLPAVVISVLSVAHTLLGMFSGSVLAPAVASHPVDVQSIVASATAAGEAELQASKPTVQ